MLLHDNARSRTAQKLAQIHWTAFEHAPYSSDLPSCNFHMFEPLKQVLGAERFENGQHVEEFMRNWINTRSKL